MVAIANLVPQASKKKAKVWITCRICGKEFHQYQCRIGQGGRPQAGLTCSKACGDQAKRRAPEYRATKIDPHGYVLVFCPDHPIVQARLARGSSNRYVRQHRLVMEQHLGRFLEPYEIVHHKNGVRDDNRIENLEVWDKASPSGARQSDLLAEVSFLRVEIARLNAALAALQPS